MFKNYLKMAFRQLKNQKTYSFINILGLATGITFCILTFLFINHEMTYDTFHKNANNIYRLNTLWEDRNGLESKNDLTYNPLGPILVERFPEVNRSLRLIYGFGSKINVTYNGKEFTEVSLFTDPNFFNFFSFPLKHGNQETVFQNKNSVVITENIAKKYFGKKNPIGKRMSIRGLSYRESKNDYDFIVTGVAENLPKNSSVYFDFLIPIKAHSDINEYDDFQSWRYSQTTTFVELSKDPNIEKFERNSTVLVKKHTSPKKAGLNFVKINLQQLSDIHFATDVESYLPGDLGNLASIYILAGLAIFVLSIASINFINLSIGRISSRIKELSVRKVVGAMRSQLVIQFLSESILISAISLVLGIIFAALFLPMFNYLIQKELVLNLFDNNALLLFFISLIIIIGIISGFYPALILSAFHPVSILKSKIKLTGVNWFSRILISVQYAFSILFIICTVIMLEQQHFIASKDLGIKKEFVVSVNMGYDKYLSPIYKEKLCQYPNVTNVSSVRYGFEGPIKNTILLAGGKEFEVKTLHTDLDFLETMSMTILAGTNFSKANDRAGVMVVNETFLKKLNLVSPLGQYIRFEETGLMKYYYNHAGMQIIGIVQDFHYKSLHHQIEPITIFLNNHPKRDAFQILVRIKPDNIAATIALMEKELHKLNPDIPFEYTFLDSKIEQQYQNEKRWNKIIGYSALFAISIACLGIFGLIALVTERRTKEIGIRKVIGASIPNILILLTKDFTKWILLANLIAWPIAYYAMHKLLQNFAYRIDLTIWPFVFAGSAALVIALLTLSNQALRAATANPVEALQYE